MCYHCCDWWPVNDLGRALLGLDKNTPYWLHGVYLSDLADLCCDVVEGTSCSTAATRAWVQAVCPDFRALIEAHIAGGGERGAPCEIDTLFTLQNRGTYAATGKHGDQLADVELKVNGGKLWEPRGDGALGGRSPLKSGRFPLKRAEAWRPEAYDDRFFYEPADGDTA